MSDELGLKEQPIGRVLNASTTGFAVGCRVPLSDVPAFGALARVSAQSGRCQVYGMIYDIYVDDDPLVRQLSSLPDPDEEVIQDQLRNRHIPIEVSLLVAGHRANGRIVHSLPPQPPLSLDRVYLCDEAELVEFTSAFDYFGLVLAMRQIPADELLSAHLRLAAAARGADGRRFLVEAGRELARLLGGNLVLLENVLRRIRPND
jgi:hypothetical protein